MMIMAMMRNGECFTVRIQMMRRKPENCVKKMQQQHTHLKQNCVMFLVVVPQLFPRVHGLFGIIIISYHLNSSAVYSTKYVLKMKI